MRIDDKLESLNSLIDLLTCLEGAGPVERWRPDGVVTANCRDYEYIPLFWGDDDGNLVSQLLPDERVLVEDSCSKK